MRFKNFIIPIIIFLIGIGFYILGVLFKILHWQISFLNGAIFIVIASFLQLFAIVISIIKLASAYKSNK